MNPSSLTCSAVPFRAMVLLFGLALAGCATQSASSSTVLPYHIAIVPPDVRTVDVPLPEGDMTSMKIAFDPKVVAKQVTTACEVAFAKATMMPAEVGAGLTGEARLKAYAKHAEEKIRADVLLQPQLTYDTEVSTQSASLVLSCLAFALGGPVGWFVEDRGYLCKASMLGEVYDVSTLNLNESIAMEDGEARLLKETREAREHVMRFIDRADGAGSYFLSLICPAVFLAKETAAVEAGVAEQFGDQLSAALVEALREKSGDLREAEAAVDFVVDGPRLVDEGSKRRVEGRVILNPVNTRELAPLSFRFATDGDWRQAEWKAKGSEGRKLTFDFTIPVDSAAAGLVQVKVQANDANKRHRTYSIRIPGTQGS